MPRSLRYDEPYLLDERAVSPIRHSGIRWGIGLVRLRRILAVRARLGERRLTTPSGHSIRPQVSLDLHQQRDRLVVRRDEDVVALVHCDRARVRPRRVHAPAKRMARSRSYERGARRALRGA